MLSIEENKKLCETDQGTIMGDYIRRFWIPFRLSSDVPEADGAPIRIKLMGEDLLAFRNTKGDVGLIQSNCPHRWADLFFGRNEESGIRCTYHGWKFDSQGNCVDMPTETDESTYKDKIKIAAYPVKEIAGILWTYMGPKQLTPEIPDFEYLKMPESHRFVSWNWQQTNYAQAIEGGIDSAHSNYLHASLDAYNMTEAWKEQWQKSQNLRDKYHARDQHPKFFAEDTDYGVITGARRDTGEGEFYWRYNLFLLPFYTMPPSAPTQKFFHAFVPIDDHNNMRWTFVWNLARPLLATDVEDWRNGSGLHAAALPGPDHWPLRNKENDYLINRDYQKTLSFTGITGTGEQDFSVQEGMGPITPRNKEHLGTTDIGIIKSRRRLLKEATALQDGSEPEAASKGNVYYLRSGDVLLGPEQNWVKDPVIQDLQTATW
ncbi:MAG: (2Fe-2S)-binding protein [Chloroflexi bacterium]|jgi:phthalate 4,5-dioxygenase oxygenase subunit|nr:(2Fe-2S)-binding protein [Chloroflexota bacterium]|tara:strand:+ start:3146 stop:4438 length:1293 start_codon:yes stop_codon:yes gene_type:complete